MKTKKKALPLTKEAAQIIAAYPKGVCPDCGFKIPRNVVDGAACLNCEHVFSLGDRLFAK